MSLFTPVSPVDSGVSLYLECTDKSSPPPAPPLPVVLIWNTNRQDSAPEAPCHLPGQAGELADDC